MTGNGRVKKLVRRILFDRERTISGDRKMILDIEKWPVKWQDRIKTAHTVAVYMPIKTELEIASILGSPLFSGKTIVYPRVEGENIVFYEVSGEKDFVTGSFGIREPAQGLSEVSASSIDIMLVPATAYGRDGTRLGHGKGFYDRYCSREGYGFSGDLIGVVPEKDLLGTVPGDEWDIKVDAICTEERFLQMDHER